MLLADKKRLSALYYPYAEPKSVNKMKKALLFFDDIYFVSPVDYRKNNEDSNNIANAPAPAPNSPETSAEKRMDQRSYNNTASSDNFAIENLFKRKLFKEIDPADTVKGYREFIIEALNDDKNDKVFENECKNNEPRWTNWIIHESKGIDQGSITPTIGKYIDRNTLTYPFLEGESVMISHALFAAYSKKRNGESVTLITDEYFHERLLKRRLTRGVQRIHQTRSAAIEEVIDILIPDPKGTIEDFLEKRNKHQTEFNKIRNLIMKEAFNPSTSISGKSETYREIQSLYKRMFEEEDSYAVTPTTALATDPRTAFFGEESMRFSRSPSPDYGMITTAETPVSRNVRPDLTYEPSLGTSLTSVIGARP